MIKITDKKTKETKTKETKTKETKQQIKFKVPTIAWFVIAWISLAFLGVWMKTNLTLEITNNSAIATASISIMVNVIILGAVLATGIGQKVLQRFKNRILFHTGRYVNTIYTTKNGTAKEHFKAVDPDTKTFMIAGQKFVRNPRLLINFERIPTYFHREGNPDPLNIFEDKYARELSNVEMDIAMTSSQNFDLKQWIIQNKAIVIMGALIIIGAAAAAAASGFMSYQMLRDGTYKAIDCVATIAANTITSGV